MRLLVEVGQVCESYQDRVFRKLPCRLIQLDELWGFNYCKAKNVTPTIAEKISGAGDVWLWVAIEQLGRREDPAADAVAALVDLLFDPGLLDAVRGIGRPQPR